MNPTSRFEQNLSTAIGSLFMQLVATNTQRDELAEKLAKTEQQEPAEAPQPTP